MEPYEELYGRKCRTPLTWVEVGERQLMGPKLVDEAIEKIRLIKDKLKAAQDRQQKYYDPKHRAVEFEKIGKVSYRLALPADMLDIHNVFHVSLLRKWVIDVHKRISYDEIDLQKNLTYTEELEGILDVDTK
ncbi:hypothetical protein MA16_Dca017321 [Dendrobium catenatum]|uniref:Tf2-1-like SH3-like domain-containing protein n=1 Tax=Dendrobium catenatum TaxID=906689 RepID=A0A2I0XG50_9ASPA|nr:hypothetical protein MA16_Dca017321 [Dendrobium catenatum]